MTSRRNYKMVLVSRHCARVEQISLQEWKSSEQNISILGWQLRRGGDDKTQRLILPSWKS